VSAGPLGVWGLDLKNEVYFRDGTFGDPEDSEGTGWTKVGERKKKQLKIRCNNYFYTFKFKYDHNN
jgi:hypothetical protein